MATNVKRVGAVMRSGIGTQDFTFPDFGTPQLAMFMLNSDAAGDDPQSDNSFQGFGATDGVNEFAQWALFYSASGISLAYTATISTAAVIILKYQVTDQIIGSFDSWITDGVRIDFTTESGNFSPYIECILINGLTNVEVGYAYDFNSGTFDVDCGFEPNAFMVIEGYSHAGFSIGFGLWSGSAMTYGMMDKRAEAETSNWEFLSDSSIDSRTFDNDNAALYQSSTKAITGVDSAGFTFTNSPAVDKTNNFYIAMKTIETDAYIGFVDLPITTGVVNYTDIGFTPAFLMCVTTSSTVIDELTSAREYDSVLVPPISIFTVIEGVMHSHCMSGEYDDDGAVAFGNIYSLRSTTTAIKNVYWVEHAAATTWYEADWNGYVTNGFSLDFTTVVNNGAVKMLVFAIGEYTPPDFHPLETNDAIDVAEDITLQKIIYGSVAYGHVTSVAEDNAETFIEQWAGSGSVVGSGDAEKLVLSAGQNMISQPVNFGSGPCLIKQNNYASGNEGTLYYRTATTYAGCEAAGWTAYTGEFTSLGYVSTKVEKT